MAKPYPPEVKAAVLAALAAGDTVYHVSRVHKVPRGTVQHWRDAAGLTPMGPGLAEKREVIGRKLLDLTEQCLDAMGFILTQASDASWRSRQSADELGVFFGIVADKGYRLLAALRPADDASRQALEASIEPDATEG